MQPVLPVVIRADAGVTTCTVVAGAFIVAGARVVVEARVVVVAAKALQDPQQYWLKSKLLI